MEDQNPSQAWDRPHFTPGGGDAALLYAVFGDFPPPLRVDAAAHRSTGLPAGVGLTAYSRADQREFVESVYGGWLGQSLRVEDPDLFAAVESAPTCVVMRGVVADPPTLIYLRDAVGVLTALLDGGGVALLDWQALAWFSPGRWRERVFAPSAPVPTQHVSILLSPEETREEDGEPRLWVHTRGMRKFGRPDVSIHGVAPDDRDAFVGLCNRFIVGMAFGGIVPEGRVVRVAGLPWGMTCHHGGDPEDPDFNNVHIEVRPAPPG